MGTRHSNDVIGAARPHWLDTRTCTFGACRLDWASSRLEFPHSNDVQPRDAQPTHRAGGAPSDRRVWCQHLDVHLSVRRQSHPAHPPTLPPRRSESCAAARRSPRWPAQAQSPPTPCHGAPSSGPSANRTSSPLRRVGKGCSSCRTCAWGSAAAGGTVSTANTLAINRRPTGWRDQDGARGRQPFAAARTTRFLGTLGCPPTSPASPTESK